MDNNKNKSKLLQMLDELFKASIGMLKTLVVVLLLDIVVITLGLLILDIGWLSVPIALGIAVIDMLPVLGSGIAFIPWIIYAAYIGNYTLAIGLGILYAVLTVMKIFLQPLLCGKQIGLPPLLSIGAAAAGVMLFGGVGIFVGPLLVVAWRSVYKK